MVLTCLILGLICNIVALLLALSSENNIKQRIVSSVLFVISNICMIIKPGQVPIQIVISVFFMIVFITFIIIDINTLKTRKITISEEKPNE